MDKKSRDNLLGAIRRLRTQRRPLSKGVPPPSVQILNTGTPQRKGSVGGVARATELLHSRRSIRGYLLNMMHAPLSPADSGLLAYLTTLHPYSGPVVEVRKGVLYIHWYYRTRSDDCLSACEIFHLNMLLYFGVPGRVNSIHIRCASQCGGRTSAMDTAVRILEDAGASVDFRMMPNSCSWEHDTFREAVEYSVSTGEFVYYTHFKGVTRIGDPSVGVASRNLRGSSDLDIYYWCYLMYLALFTAPDGVRAIGPLLHLGKNKSYSNRDISWSRLCQDGSVFHYCGSFQAFSGKYIAECLRNCGFPDMESRDRKLWVRDPYTVEMFLSMVALKDDVYTLDVPYTETNRIYRIYTDGRIRNYVDGFRNIRFKECADGT